MATHQRNMNNTIYKPVQTSEELEKQMALHREKIKSLMSKLNPNVEIPEPKIIEVVKAAIKLP